MSESPEIKARKAKAFEAIRAGRKPFRGYPPERAAGKQARKNMMRVFMARGFYPLAERLHKLKLAQVGWIEKRRRLSAILDKYAGAVTGA
jgi:hypothetical protein